MVRAYNNNNNKHFKCPLIKSQRCVLRHEYHGLYISVNQNKNDFSICLKVPNVTAGSRSAAGRAFLDAGPEVVKAHGPRVTVRVRICRRVSQHLDWPAQKTSSPTDVSAC